MTQLQELAAKVGGTLIGDGATECHGASPLGQARDGEVTMIEDLTRNEQSDIGAATALVTPAAIADLDLAQIVVSDPHEAFATIVSYFRPPMHNWQAGQGIAPSADIDPSAEIHSTATIGAGVRIGARVQIHPNVVVMPHCQIGDDVVLYPNVTLYEYTRVGDRVVIHAGSVIGAHGFGYRQKDGRHVPTAQLGFVDIQEDVDLGACVTVDRGTYGATRIGKGSKIDNQVMIAHNCIIGQHNLICSQVGIAGSCRTGDYVILAGQVGLKDHITLGDRTIVGAQAGVMDDCEGNDIYLGSPATRQKEQMQIMAVERRLPEMRREIKHLRRDIDRLQQTDQTARRVA